MAVTAASRGRSVIWRCFTTAAARTAAEIQEATRHEALINLAFGDSPVTFLCSYDRTALAGQSLPMRQARTRPSSGTGRPGWPSVRLLAEAKLADQGRRLRPPGRHR
jgi:hypothetical protein